MMSAIRNEFKRAALIGIVGCAATVSHAGFVSETATEFFTTADLNGDGFPDILVVDKASGTFRAGYQLVDQVFTWSESRGLGATNITGLATGPMLNTGLDAIAATTPLLNRVNLIEALKPTQPAFPVPVFGNEYGPEILVSLEIGGDTPEADLLVVNSMSTPTPYRLEQIKSHGSSFAPDLAYAISDVWKRGNRVVFNNTDAAAAFMDRSVNAFRMYDFSSGSVNHLNSKFFGGALSSPDYCPIYPTPGDYVHLFVWDAGTTNCHRFQMTAGENFSALTAVNFGAPIASIHSIPADGTDWLIVIFADGSAKVYSYDGTQNPAFLQDLPLPATGLTYSGIVSSGPNRFMALTADPATGHSTTAEDFIFDNGTFTSLGTQSLPSVKRTRGQANVFTFRNEPFVSSNPQRLQALSAGDWSRLGGLTGSPLNVDVEFETDRGLPLGLGNRDAATLGYADLEANHVLVNQAGDSFSVHSTEAALGDQEAEAFISPAPGHYQTGIEITFSNTTGDDIFYREAGSNGWTPYTQPIPAFESTELLFFAQRNGDIERGPIQTAIYTFDVPPEKLDSDGDSIPDYVELANGLDPLQSGLDGDGDGFSDLEELLGGSNPTDPASTPALPIPGTSGRLEQQTAFDLQVTPFPYDGTANTVTSSTTGTALRVYSSSGWQYAYGVASNQVGSADPSILFTNLPSTIESGFFTLLTERHFAIDTPNWNKNRGIEMAAVQIPPAITGLEVTSPYSGIDIYTDAGLWIDAAYTALTNSITPKILTDLTTDDVLTAMLVERKLIDELYDAAVITNRLTTLFPARPSDQTMDRVAVSDLLYLRNNTNRAFLPETVIQEIETYTANAGSAALRALTEDLYDICSTYTDSNPGAYPLPMTVLRDFLLTGTLHSNYAASLPAYTAPQLSAIHTDAMNALNLVNERPIENLMLEVREGSFTNACPVLWTGGNQAKSLYDAEGRPYIMPFSFELGIGAMVQAQGFTDVAWNRVPGTDPMQIISLSLTAVPVSSDLDADGNLLPDALENTVLQGTGNVAHQDSDSDGYSDLQEYLDGTDPGDALSVPSGPIADLSPPEIFITSLSADQVRLDVQWPAAYAESFRFSVIYSDDLADTGFSTVDELSPGALSTVLNTASSDARFFKIGISLR
ncbi:hypothetical protein [Pontiella agarivorans]|uniref:Uncharacterized protein n=1 Tax=Pontiella agarivorans TaxID=3038953 RepID=A0ABU5MXT6_9BACT|nr:hypothetical protein [Pontiella agarivorans]MDZ8119013.1 hypothetical protein [Pontiella agarivorans]